MAKTTAKKSAPAKKAADVKKPAAKKAATPKVTAPAKRPKLKLPPEGIYVGSGIYPTDTDTLLCTMIGHYTWQAQHFDVLEQIEKIIDDNQGNLAQVWGIARGFSPKLIADWFYALDEIGIDIPAPDWENYKNLTMAGFEDIFEKHKDRFGAGLVRFIREAKKRGIYTCLMYTKAEPQWIKALSEEGGDYYLGYDYGEGSHFSAKDGLKCIEETGECRLSAVVQGKIDRVREHVEPRHKAGWGLVMATSSNFSVDYEVLGGTDVPVIEDFAFQGINLASALSRGLYRQHDLAFWGSHLAHEHYAWLPNSDSERWNTLRAAFWLKYMAGSKMIINESGNWFVEHTLSPDSPKFDMPQTCRKSMGIIGWGTAKQMMKEQPETMKSYLEEARKFFPRLNYESPVCRQYRKVISEFWDYVKANGTPAGQPESVIALIKGNYDLSNATWNPNYAVGGMFPIADKNPSWYHSVPERGMQAALKVFYPCDDALTAPHRNIQISGTPYGQVDMISFAFDMIDPEFLAKQYKAIMFTGWNTCSKKQYEILKKYVELGGTLFTSIAQLSTNETRNFDYGLDEIVNGGDLSELCGFKVTGKGDRLWWATAPIGQDKLGFTFPRRYGCLCQPLAKLEITDPELEILSCDDEVERPVVTLHKYGKGKVYTMTTWSYPGALDIDDCPGNIYEPGGLLGRIYRTIAEENRPNVYITDDGKKTGKACLHVAFSYFPEAGKICLFNVDYHNEANFYLHQFGTYDKCSLAPGEFRMIDATKC